MPCTKAVIGWLIWMTTATCWTLSANARDDRPAKVNRSLRPQSGIASFYGAHAAGKKTASGAKFHPNRLTAASKTLPLGTKARVTNIKTGKSVNVTVTDRGPYAKSRVLDVSPKAADRLGMRDSGVSEVKIKPIQIPAMSH